MPNNAGTARAIINLVMELVMASNEVLGPHHYVGLTACIR